MKIHPLRVLFRPGSAEAARWSRKGPNRVARVGSIGLRQAPIALRGANRLARAGYTIPCSAWRMAPGKCLRLVMTTPRSPDTAYEHGLAHLKCGEYEAAVAALSEAISAAPKAARA